MNDKLDELQNRIESAKAKQTTPIHKNTSSPFIIATELVSGVVVGVIIGVLLDKLFDSKPLFLIICIIFGVVVSFKNIWQRVNTK